MSSVVLTGFMGTGKTSVGKALADRYGLSFIDLDCQIERTTGRSVSEIFEQSGEEAFRRLETKALETVLGVSDSVIATGGGTLIAERNRDLLKTPQVFTLHCQPDQLRQRLGGTVDRPLLTSKSWEEVEVLLEKRKGAYDGYSQIDTTARSPLEVADEIGRIAMLNELTDIYFDNSLCSRIRFERGLLNSAKDWIPLLNLDSQVVLVIDETVAGLQISSSLSQALRSGRHDLHLITIPTGEEHKTLKTVRHMYGACLEGGIERSAVVIGLGGGVVCDIAGMLAATYLRGLRLVLIPTTLLAQADAAVGGKVGVDFAGTKNLLGSFYPAEFVLIDPAVLSTLPVDLLSQGLVEIVKMGAMLSPDLFESVEGFEQPGDVLSRPAAVRAALTLKAGVVERDPRERGERAFLNYGHTVGHALEAASRFTLSHGDAVGIGMLAELHLAAFRGWCEAPLSARIEDLLRRFGLPTTITNVDPEEALEYLAHDKKRKARMTRIAVPTKLGSGAMFEVTESEVRASIERVLGERV